MAFLDRHGPSWWIAERDPMTGRKRRVEKCYTDRRISAVKLANWNRTKAAGEVGMLDKYSEHRHRPLTAHLAEYIGDLTAKRRDAVYIDTTNKRLAKLFGECGWKVLGDISADGFRRWRERTPAESVTMLDGRKRKQTIRGATTLNQYLGALKAFCRWGSRRMAENPVEHLEGIDGTGDVRRKRRSLTEEQVGTLLAVVPESDRDAYVVAVLTGLRVGEMKVLEWEDVRLDSITPHLRLRAEATKAGREETPALHAGVVEVLKARRELMGGSEASGKVFPRVPTLHAHKAYLEAAGIPYRDAQGRQLDRHALRVTFGTMLAKAGVSVREAMGLMRHTSERLTTKVYVDAAETVFGLKSAVDRINFSGMTTPVVVVMTGTGGGIGTTKEAGMSFMGSAMGSADTPHVTSIGNLCLICGDSSVSTENENPPVFPGDYHNSALTDTELRPTGVEPARVASLEPESSANRQKRVESRKVEASVGSAMGSAVAESTPADPVVDPVGRWLAGCPVTLPEAIRTAVLAMVEMVREKRGR